MRILPVEKVYYVTGDGVLRAVDLGTGLSYLTISPETHLFSTALEALLDGRNRVIENLTALNVAIAAEVKK